MSWINSKQFRFKFNRQTNLKDQERLSQFKQKYFENQKNIRSSHEGHNQKKFNPKKSYDHSGLNLHQSTTSVAHSSKETSKDKNNKSRDSIDKVLLFEKRYKPIKSSL